MALSLLRGSQLNHLTRSKIILAEWPCLKALKRTSDVSFLYVGIAQVISTGLLLCIFRPALSQNGWFALAMLLPFSLMVYAQIYCMHCLVHDSRTTLRTKLKFGYALNAFLVLPSFFDMLSTHWAHHKCRDGLTRDETIRQNSKRKVNIAPLFGDFSKVFRVPPFVVIIRTGRLKLHLSGDQWRLGWLELSATNAIERENILVQFALDVFLVAAFGWKCLCFLALANQIGHALTSLIAYHPSESSTISRQHSWFNLISLNNGYHLEHHDFPQIPQRYLPQIARVAKNAYLHERN